MWFDYSLTHVEINTLPGESLFRRRMKYSLSLGDFILDDDIIRFIDKKSVDIPQLQWMLMKCKMDIKNNNVSYESTEKV